MVLKEKLNLELKESLKSGNTQKRLTVGMILSSIKNKELEKRTKLSKTITNAKKLQEECLLNEEEILGVIGAEAKKRKESIDLFTKGGRDDLVKKENDELKIIMAFLPEQIGEEELKKIIKEAISQTGASSAKDMGKVIGIVAAQVKGKTDGATISRIVKEELGA
jgi:hypothetical protein